MEQWAVLNDIQLAYHDEEALDLVLRFLQKTQPCGVILNGDIFDCYQISDFDKDPMNDKDLDVEIATGRGLFSDLREITERLIFIPGNHEDRWRRMIWRKAPCLAKVKGMSFQEVFGLNDFKIECQESGYWLGKLYVTHGTKVRQHSAYTARAHFEKYGVSVLIGHTHRGGVYYHTNLSGPHAAYENFCLCRMDLEYVKHPDWQQGFSLVHVDHDGSFHVDQLPILRDKHNQPYVMYGGERRI